MANQINTENARTSIDVDITVDGHKPAISDVPDLGATPEQIDVTAIGEDTRKYINGIEDPGELEFTCFYEKAIYEALETSAAKQKVDIVINLKEAGSLKISGKISVSLSGFGVGDAISFVLKITPDENGIVWTPKSSS